MWTALPKAVWPALMITLMLSPAAVSQSQWTDLGSGLAGTSGVPSLTGAGGLSPASPNSVSLSGAAPSALSQIFLALQQQPTAFKGGLLTPLPTIPLPLTTTSPTGAVFLPFIWPTGLPESLPFYMQYAVQDAGAPQGVALSNALRAVSSGSLPLLDTVSPLLAAEGDVLTIQGVNLPPDPLDIVALLVLPGDVMVGLLNVQASDGNTVTALIDFLDPQATQARVAVGGGEGQLFVPASLPPSVSLPEGPLQVWSGDPANIEVSPQTVFFDTDPSAPQLDCTLVHGSVTSDWISIVVPEEACQPGARVTFFLSTYTVSGSLCKNYKVALQVGGGGSPLECAVALADMLVDAMWTLFGQVVIPQVLASGPDALLRYAAPVGDQWGSGSKARMKVCLPVEPLPEGCSFANGGLDVNLQLKVAVPAVIPDDAAIKLTFYGNTLPGAVWSAQVTLDLNGASSAAAAAAAIVPVMQAALDQQGFPGKVKSSEVDGVTFLQVKSGGAPWGAGNLFLQICP